MIGLFAAITIFANDPIPSYSSIPKEELYPKGAKIVVAEDGSLMVSEEVSGPSASVAYGEPAHKLRAIFSPRVIGDLVELLGDGTTSDRMGTVLRAYFKNGEHALIDLMDLCDLRRVPYAYQSLGSTGVTYRPSFERP